MAADFTRFDFWCCFDNLRSMCPCLNSTVVLNWFNIAMRLEHTRRVAAGLGADTPNAWLGEQKRGDMESAKRRL